MTQEEFIAILDRENYSYIEEDGRIVINHSGNVFLYIDSFPSDIEFRNEGDVWFERLTYLPHGTVFANTGGVYFRKIIRGWFRNWKGNIDGIYSKRLLSFMIKDGVFER